jgi:hypothetical protein
MSRHSSFQPRHWYKGKYWTSPCEFAHVSCHGPNRTRNMLMWNCLPLRRRGCCRRRSAEDGRPVVLPSFVMMAAKAAGLSRRLAVDVMAREVPWRRDALRDGEAENNLPIKVY